MWLLSAGAALGLGLAAGGLLRSGGPGSSLPPGAVALVNDAVIRADDFERLVGGVERDTNAAATEVLRERVLARMIEEELLVQRALELGLARADRRVRADLVSAVIASVTADPEREPTLEELREFYEEEREFFTQPGRMHLRQVFFRVRRAEQDAEAALRAEQASARLRAGESIDGLRAELGDDVISPVPAGLLPAQKLLEYLGPTAVRAALALPEGETSDPVRSGTGYHVLQVVAREEAIAPVFEGVIDVVRAEWTRRGDDRALREYLDELRERARVVR